MNHHQKAQEAIAGISRTVEDLLTRIRELTTERNILRLQVNQAEQRAVLAERSCETLRSQASRTAELEGVCGKLLEALERLPTKMEDAGVKQMAFKPDIPLYGTHEWQAVVDAKFSLAALVKKGEKHE